MTDSRIYFSPQPLLPIDSTAKTAVASVPANKNAASFQSILQQAEKKVSFSQHAISRMQSRGISLNEQTLTKLNDTVEKLARKGAKESLIYLKNEVALVVSIKNRTVITAMEGARENDNIITNIDSAAII